MKRLRVYIALAVLTLLSITVLPLIGVFNATPDLFLSFVVFCAVAYGSRIGMEIGIAAGIIEDLFAFDIFGVNALILCAVGFAAGHAGTNFARESRMVRFLLVLAFSGVASALHFSIEAVLARPAAMGAFEFISRSIVPVAMYTAVISVPVFAIYERSFGLRTDEEYL